MARCARTSPYLVGLLLLGGLCLGIAGCSTVAPPQADGSADAESSRRSIPEPVRRHILARETSVALMIRPGRWDELAPAVEQLSTALPLGPTLDSISTALRKHGLFEYLTHNVGGFRAPGSLVGDGPVYVRFDLLGADRFLEATRVGLPVPAPVRGGHYPAGTAVRFLVPSDHPGVLAEAVEVADDGRRRLEITASQAGDFCRIDVLQFGRYVGGKRRARMLDRRTEAGGDDTGSSLSPAARRFARSTSPVAAYADTGALRRLYLARRGIAIGAAASRASRPDRRRWVVHGSAVGTAVHLMALRSARGIAKYVVRVNGDESGGVCIDGTATRTRFGRHLWDATTGSRRLPAPAVPAQSSESLVADVTFGRDWRALEQQAPGAVDLFGGDVPTFRDAGDIAHVSRVSGAGLWVGWLHSPGHLYRLGSAVSREWYGMAPPSFLRMRMARVPGETTRPIRGGLQALFAFGGVGDERRRRVSGLRRLLDRLQRRDIGIDYRLDGADDETGRLTVAAGMPVEEASGDTAASVGTGLRLTAVPGRVLEALEWASADPALIDALEGLRTLPPVHLQTAASSTITRFRLHVGPQPPEPLEVGSSSARLADLPDRVACLDRMTVAVHHFKRALPALGPSDLEGVSELLDELRGSIAKCGDDSAVGDTYRDWVLGRAAWLAGWRAEIAWHKRLARGEAGRRRTRKVADTLYRRACAKGDSAGCKARRALPPVD